MLGGNGSDTFVFAKGDAGTKGSAIDKIMDFTKGSLGVGDLIEYSNTLSIGGNDAAASKTQASINNSTGIATFDTGSGNSLGDAVGDIAGRFNAVGDHEGQLAFFKVHNTSDYYLFIADGKAGPTSDDVVIQLVDVNNIGGIQLDGNHPSITS